MTISSKSLRRSTAYSQIRTNLPSFMSIPLDAILIPSTRDQKTALVITESKSRAHLRMRSKTIFVPDPRSLSLPDHPVTAAQRFPKLIATRPTSLKKLEFKHPTPPEASRVFIYYLPDLMDLEEHLETSIDGHQVVWTTTISTFGSRYPDVQYFPVLHRFFLGFNLIAEQYDFVHRSKIPEANPNRHSPPSTNAPWSKFPHRYHKYARNLYKTMHRRGFKVSRYIFVTSGKITDLRAGEVLQVKARRVFPR